MPSRPRPGGPQRRHPGRDRMDRHERPAAGDLSGVLRSWEDRFGARLVGLGHGTAFVSAAAGPADLDEAHRLALEHYLTSPDTVEQGMVTFSEYAAGLLGRPLWRLWWD
ncbi:DUF4253 domain-containing protein [Streptomyces sp. NPDC047990]|uniref:DUF4253 domain-containing protein n=1 Tax=Streptomyces sp. NPDC047990 TaxID=3365496 RepID=UPI0037164A5A